ncbi:MAG: NTP transferase domain-containing protein [Rhodothermia bacterium]
MSHLNRTGIILAAGFGSRLQGVSDETSLKPLTSVGGTPLIFRTIASLARAGCRRVVIVLGHGADDIRRSVSEAYQGPTELLFTVNPKYELQNGLSVLAARQFVGDEFVLTMADHVFGDSVMGIAAGHTPVAGGATLLVDYKLDTIFDMDDATKVLAKDDRIARIGKQIAEFNCVDTGVFVGTDGLMDAIDDVYRDTGDASLSDGVQTLSARDVMRVLDIGPGFWQDVDTPEMLEHANRMLA